MTKVLFLLSFVSFLQFVELSKTSLAASSGILGYQIKTGEKGIAVNCSNEDTANGDQYLCEQYSTIRDSRCEAIPSTFGSNSSSQIFICNPPGESYCFRDMDCKILGKNTCVTRTGSSQRFEDQFEEGELDANTEFVGICASIGGSGEDNAFGQAICNLMNVVTGNAGRAVVGVVVIVVGIMFFLGKVTWSLVLAIALGAGAIFGAPAIVSVVTGKPFICK